MTQLQSGFPFDQPVVWTPTTDQIEASNLVAFQNRMGLPDLAALEHKAAGDPAWFWSRVLADLDIRFEQPWTQVLDLSQGKPHARWCVDGRLNITVSCLDKWQQGTDVNPEADLALIQVGEDGRECSLSYGGLFRKVEACAAGLRSLGLGIGDSVGIWMPMVPETVIAFLAIIRIGAIALPLFSGFGPSAVVDRLLAGRARAVVTVDGYRRRRRWVDAFPILQSVRSELPNLEHVVLVRTDDPDVEPADVSTDLAVHLWSDLCEPTPVGHAGAAEIMDSEDPCLVIFTSGTTGAPKGMVHAHCGFPVKAAQDMCHGMDVRSSDTVFWHTDLGWMMGPWLIFGSLLLGGTMVIYDGAPDWPGADRIWEICARHGVTLLGISPTLARSMRGQGAGIVKRHDLSALKAVASSGSPWDPASWMWVFEQALDGTRPILNYSGGTEISGGIVGCSVVKPLKPCSFNAPLLGMEVDVVDERGESVRERIGELVVRNPWIGMTRGFWQDGEGRYLDTYWSEWPDLWRQGDLAVLDSDGFWFLLGRSDDTMNVSGKRLGPAEYEQVLVRQPDVAEAAAVGVPDPLKGQKAVCFCVPSSDSNPDPELGERLRAVVAGDMGRALRPDAVCIVPALPKTRNAKVMRRLLRDMWQGEPLGDTTNLEDRSILAGVEAAIRACQAAMISNDP